ncbi:tachylectin-related carbohydrate-binding protein [Allokutzneria sp. A3M-2-11 16]|uniref:tachylectin-related carbohydrate-binding protein n=1 Tax=Allokutzneria sp. A3M-2-11 16 TaxID=2962043 RepID=UPI0020B7873A|nr:tachylectin-related carbohydrate-binding protein [Allokutzneria sp. A3M-2-11 16]MCP3799987.1 tachylectin-related carbohydrate-binding protein [Allokutzneria sp. A3M-2-11 16]
MRITALAAVAALGSTLLFGGTASAAPKAAELLCNPPVQTLGVDPNGGLWLNRHEDPVGGAARWGQAQVLGGGWTGRTIAGPDGSVFALIKEGEIHRWRWNGTGWDAPPPGQPFDVIARGDWVKKFLTPEYRNRISFDNTGAMVTIEPGGELWRNPYNPQTHAWGPARLLATGWDKYNAVVTSWDGAIFGRDDQGRLFRHHHNATSDRWIDEVGVEIGSGGWQNFTRLFSPGGGLIYGMTTSGQLKWHRVTDGRLDPGSGKVLISGWTAEADITAFTDQCSENTLSTPDAPQIAAKPNSRTNVFSGRGSGLDHVFVDHQRSLFHLWQASPTSEGQWRVVEGYDNFVGTPSVAQNNNGSLQLIAQGADSDLRESRRANDWSPVATGTGRMASPASLVTPQGERLAAFAIDAEGRLWARQQNAPNGTFASWTRIRVPAEGAPVLSATAPTVQAVHHTTGPDTIRIFAADRAGKLWATEVYTDLKPLPDNGSRWVQLGTESGFTGQISAIMKGDERADLVVRGGDGQVYAMNELGRGFAGQKWQAVPGLTVVGEPQAVYSPNGSVGIAARDAAGALYFTERKEDGTFHPWGRFEGNAPASATDPSVTRYQHTQVVLSFRDAQDEIWVTALNWGAQAPGGKKKAEIGKVTFTKIKKKR